MQGGQQTALDRAHRRWKKLVESHQDPALDETTARQLGAFVMAHT
jgi:trimethylamine:corrinoid methyltransferase-like protein